MANTLKFKRGLVAGLPTAALGEPLFTTDTFDLYIGNGTGNTRFQKYIASGTTSQLLRGDGSLLTMPIVLTSPSNGQVLKYNGTSWVNDSDAGITGSLTTNYLPKATGATTLGNSLVYDNGTNILIGTTTAPSSSDVKISLNSAGGSFIGFNFNGFGGSAIGSTASNSLTFFTATGAIGSETYTERARFTSANGNFHIGTFSSDSGQRLQVNGTAFFSGNTTTGTTSAGAISRVYSSSYGNNGFFEAFGTDGVSKLQIGAISNTNAFIYSPASVGLLIYTGNALRATLDASGNLGLGVTPSAWGGGARGAIDLGTYGGVASTSTIGTALAWNTFHNGTNWIAKLTGASYGVLVFDNSFKWLQASSGTAGSTVSLTQAMTLDASGNLLVGSTTSSGERLQVTGTAKITGATTITSTLSINTSGQARTISTFYGANSAGGNFFIGGGGASSVGVVGETFRGSNNTSVGVNALFNNTTGYQNSAIGTSSMLTNTTGYQNAALGMNSIYSNTTGFYNSGMGVGALFSNTTGSSNTALGYNAGYGTGTNANTTGSNNIFIGSQSVGVDATQSNRTWIGNSSTTSTWLGGNLLVGTTTDSGYKLRVNGTGYFDDNVRFPNLKGIVFVQTGGSLLGSISMDSSNAVTIDNNGFFGLSVGTNYNLLGGNTGIGTNTFGTSATRTFAMLNGTAPSTSPTDTFQMYSNDVTAGNAAPHFRTENGAVIKLYQETTSVGNAIMSLGGGNAVLDDTTFDGYTLRQIVKALRNQGILA